MWSTNTKTQWKLREAGIYASSLSIAIMVSMKRAKFYVYVSTSLYLAWLSISKFLEYVSGYLTPARLASWSMMLCSGIHRCATGVFVTSSCFPKMHQLLLLPPVFVLLFILYTTVYLHKKKNLNCVVLKHFKRIFVWASVRECWYNTKPGPSLSS